MQRKNSILKASRNGMAMIMAIAIIVIIATIMALGLALTTQTTKNTADLYLHEQSVLYSKAATEYALLRVADTAPCTLSNINMIADDIYNINIDIQYVYTLGVCATQYATVTTPEQNGTILLDVTVSVTNPNIVTEPISYFRRTIQKL